MATFTGVARRIVQRVDGEAAVTHVDMELRLPLELEGKFTSAASRRSVSVDAGQTLSHDAVGGLMAKRLARHRR